MAKRCISIPDGRAANLLATGVHFSIRTIIQGRYDDYQRTLPNGTPNPQDHWSFVCEYIDRNYNMGDGVKELRRQILELVPDRETHNNNALQAFRSKFHSLKAEVRSLTGDSTNDPFNTAKSEREHVLKVVQQEIRHMYENMHHMSPNNSDDTTAFWTEILKMREIFAETLQNNRRISFQQSSANRPRDESQSYPEFLKKRGA